MNVPEAPKNPKDLSLLIRLKQYASGAASWDSSGIGPKAREACGRLYTDTFRLVQDGFAPLLGRINTAGFSTFTMHDHGHSLKVAHLMWHILAPERRKRLYPKVEDLRDGYSALTIKISFDELTEDQQGLLDTAIGDLEEGIARFGFRWTPPEAHDS